MHRPAIDGLRALAVLAVLLYHADVSWLPAGLLGVDVFFVVSGYLICSLLLQEWARHGRIDLARFWRRRARRLLPALFAMLLVVALLGPLVAHDAAPRLRGDVPAALVYVSNWWQIFHHQSYFATMGRPPLLQHLWSLAVEEQFYLLFPLLFLVGLRLVRGRARLVALAALSTAALSAVGMALWWHPGADPSRVYYGTDLHAVGLCVGVALGFLLPLHRRGGQLAAGARRALDLAGLGGLAALALLMHSMGELDAGLYRGGFAAASVATAAVVVAVSHPATRLSRLLGWAPVEWLGKRSYAVYLWHWPVFMLTRPGLDVPLSGGVLLLVRVVVVLALAEASWRLVEQPWRTGRVQRAWHAASWALRGRAVGAGLAASALALPGLLMIQAPTPPLLSASPAGGSVVAEAVPVPSATPTPTTTATPTATSAPTATAVPAAAAAPTTATASPAVAPRTVPSPPPAATVAPRQASTGPVLDVGDSVMLAAKSALVSTFHGQITVDATVGRQVDDGIAVLRRYASNGTLSRVRAVVVGLGTNGPMSSSQFDRLARLLSHVRRVVFVNVRVPRSWQGTSNASIAAGVTRYPNTVLADWYRASGRSGVLWNDGIHPNPTGATVYAQLVAGRAAAR